MLSVLLQPPHVCGAYTPPLSYHPFAGPHTESLSWHHSGACYQLSSPCASTGPAWRYLCPCQHVSPFAQVLMETGQDVGVHTSLIILL